MLEVVTQIYKFERSIIRKAESGKITDNTAVKRKQWTREHKLEFIELFEKYGNKNKAAKEFQSRDKVELNSRTYNQWVTDESKIHDS